MQLLRFVRTVSYLKPGQIFGRLVYRLNCRRPSRGQIPPRRSLVHPWIAPVCRSVSMIGATRFRFINREGDIATSAQWNDPTKADLWLYNLHYFDDLNAINANDRYLWHRSLLSRWISENAPGTGVGWHAYPTSIRLVNWLKWALAGYKLDKQWCESAAVQARWIDSHIEWHLLGNHLLTNAKALIFAGIFFEGPEADHWLKRGLEIYRKQLPEQILSDGGHFERSPMYHTIILEDLLDVLNLSRTFGNEIEVLLPSLVPAIGKMRAWLEAMTLGDGRIAFFNDAAFGVSAEPAEIEAYSIRLGLPHPKAAQSGLLRLADSGYARINLDDAIVIADIGSIGPNYLPGHAHADTLSFEFSLGKERVLVNGGTSVYEIGAQRHRERSTAAHNSVVVDQHDSSEVWSSFRVGRRARVHEVEALGTQDCVKLSASHDGYAHMRDRPIHRRKWQLTPRKLVVTDTITGRPRHAVAHFHLGAGVRAQFEQDTCGALVLASGRIIRWNSSVSAVQKASQWHPEFGLSLDTFQLQMQFVDSILVTEFNW